jgi:hypothetical protein
MESIFSLRKSTLVASIKTWLRVLFFSGTLVFSSAVFLAVDADNQAGSEASGQNSNSATNQNSSQSSNSNSSEASRSSGSEASSQSSAESGKGFVHSDGQPTNSRRPNLSGPPPVTTVPERRSSSYVSGSNTSATSNYVSGSSTTGSSAKSSKTH